MEYQDFELEITTGSAGAYQVNLLRAPAGETRQELLFGLSDDALRHKLAEIEEALRYKARLSSAAQRARLAQLQAFGGSLFHALINDNLKSLYDQSRYICKERGQGLRLKLRIDVPLLAAVPWELLYDPRHDEFLATSRQVSIVRYAALPRPAQLLANKPPLNVLGVVSAPAGLPPLDVAGEKQKVEQALQPLVSKGLAALTWLPAADWRALLRAMHRGPWHVLHYVGHSDFDAELDEGYLSLVNAQGGEERFTANKLATLLADHGALRLVLLNSCMGARIGQDIYAGVATTLVRRGIPAVIGMQYDISDAAALELARTFYETLAENLPIETALAEARKALSVGVDASAEWGAPVFYTHAPDSVLFDAPAPAPAAAMTGAPAPAALASPPAPAPSSGGAPSAQPAGGGPFMSEMYALLREHFNQSEFEALCLELDINHQDLSNRGRADGLRELVLYCRRHGRLAELLAAVRRLRPHAAWPALP